MRLLGLGVMLSRGLNCGDCFRAVLSHAPNGFTFFMMRRIFSCSVSGTDSVAGLAMSVDGAREWLETDTTEMVDCF